MYRFAAVLLAVTGTVALQVAAQAICRRASVSSVTACGARSVASVSTSKFSPHPSGIKGCPKWSLIHRPIQRTIGIGTTTEGGDHES